MIIVSRIEIDYVVNLNHCLVMIDLIDFGDRCRRQKMSVTNVSSTKMTSPTSLSLLWKGSKSENNLPWKIIRVVSGVPGSDSIASISNFIQLFAQVSFLNLQ